MKKKLMLMVMCLPLALMCACSDDDDNKISIKTYNDGWGYYAPMKHLTGIKSVTYDANDSIVDTQGQDIDCTITWNGNHVKTFKLNDVTYTYTYENDRIKRVRSAASDYVLTYAKNGVLIGYNDMTIGYDSIRVRPNKLIFKSESAAIKWDGYDLTRIYMVGNTQEITYEDNLNNPFWNFAPMTLSNVLGFYSKHCYKQFIMTGLGFYYDYQYEVTADGYPSKITLRKLGEHAVAGKTVYTLTYADEE